MKNTSRVLAILLATVWLSACKIDLSIFSNSNTSSTPTADAGGVVTTDSGTFNCSTDYAQNAVGCSQSYVPNVEACPGYIQDVTFNAQTGAVGPDNNVNAVLVLSDNEVLLGGAFQNYNGTAASYLTLLKGDGSQDTAFTPPTLSGPVAALAVQTDGKLLVGSNATSGGTTTGTIKRLTPTINTTTNTASVAADSAFTAATTNGAITAIAQSSDSKVIIVGAFTTVNGSNANHIARLNTNGTLDTAFTVSVNGTVNTVVIPSAGSAGMIIGGSFTSITPVGGSATSKTNIARIKTDGTFDSTFTVTNSDTGVNALLLQADGKLVVGSNAVSTTTTGHIARFVLGTTSSTDSAFTAGSVSGAVNVLVQQAADSKLLVAGDFVSYNSLTNDIARIVRLNTDGTVDGTFYSGTGADGVINALALQSVTVSGVTTIQPVVGGNFSNFDGASTPYLTRLNTATNRTPANCTVLPTYVSVMADCPNYNATLNATPTQCFANSAYTGSTTDNVVENFHARASDGQTFGFWGGDNLGCNGQTGQDCIRTIDADSAGTSTEINITANFNRDVTPQAATYTYNHLGQRKSKTVGSVTTYFVYSDLDGQMLGEYNSDGTPVREYVYAEGERVAMLSWDYSTSPATQSTTYFGNNHLGQTVLAWDSSGNPVYDRRQTPFGETMGEYASGTIKVALRMPGQYADDESGFNQNWNRDYDPSIGRYLQSDPIGLKGGINTYAYVAGNPVMHTDRMGLEIDGSWGYAPPYFPNRKEHYYRNKNNHCPCKEPKNDPNWTKIVSKYRNTVTGDECNYDSSGRMEDDGTHVPEAKWNDPWSWPNLAAPSIEQNYSFNYSPNPWTIKHFIQDMLPSYVYNPIFYPKDQTNGGKKCDECEAK